MMKLTTKPIRLVISPNLYHNLFYQLLDVDSPGRMYPAPLLRVIVAASLALSGRYQPGCPKMGVFRGLSPLKEGLGVSPRFKFPLPGLGRGMVEKNNSWTACGSLQV